MRISLALLTERRPAVPQEQGQEALMPKARWVGWPSALSSVPLKWGSVLSWLMGNPESLGLQAERYLTHRKCQRAGDPQTLPWLSSQEQAALRRACCIWLLKDLISLFLSPDFLREQCVSSGETEIHGPSKGGHKVPLVCTRSTQPRDPLHDTPDGYYPQLEHFPG